MIKRVFICIILMISLLISACSKADSAVQSPNNETKVTDTKSNVEAGPHQTNDKGDIELQLSMANDRIAQLESEVKGGEAYRKELEKEIELINSITKDFMYEQQLSIARKQWHYSLRVDDEQITNSTIETNKTNFKISLSEGHDAMPLVPMEAFNNGKVSGDTKEHIKFNNYKPNDMMEPAGGFVWGFVYVFDNIPHGTSIEMEISKELQERIGLDTNIVNIKVK